MNRARPVASRALVKVSLFLAACFLAACGPVAIGAGIASAGGGSDGGSAAPTIAAAPAACELISDARYDGRTVLAFTARQPQGQGIRFWLEARTGNGAFAQLADTNIRVLREGSEQEFPFDATIDGRPQWTGAATDGGVPYVLVWDHATEFGGGNELGDVFVRLRYGLPGGPDADLGTIYLIGSADLGTPGRVGRALPAISSVRVTRAGSDSDFEISVALADKGGDVAHLIAEYAFTEANGAPQWRRWVGGERDIDLPAGTTTDVTLRLDPFAEGWPKRVISRAQFRVTVSETHACRSPRELGPSTPVEGEVPDQAIGAAPQVSDVTLPSLVAGQTTVTFTVANRSARHAIRAVITGRYELLVLGIQEPIAGTARLVSPGTAAVPVVPLEPGEQRTLTIAWSAASDLGTGLSPVIGNVLSANGTFRIPASFTSLALTAAVEETAAARTQAITSAPAPTAASRVDTVPFKFPPTYDTRNGEIRFRADDLSLLIAGERLHWAANPRTRIVQILATTHRNCASVWEPGNVVALQSHVAVQLALTSYTRACGTSTVAEVVPTPFSALPNAIVRAGSTALFVEWQSAQAPLVLDLTAVHGISLATTVADPEIMPAIAFTPSATHGAVLLASRSTPTPSATPGFFTVDLTLQGIARDAALNQWGSRTQRPRYDVPGAAVPRGIGGVVSPVFQVWTIPGEFDGNPATREFAIAAPGTAYSTSGSTSGLFSLWRLELNGLAVSASALRPLPQEPADPGTDPLVAWQIAGAPDAAGATHLFLARQIGLPGTTATRVEVFTLTPGATQWRRVADPRVPDSNVILSRMVAGDFDRDGQPDAVCSFKQAIIEAGTGLPRPSPASRVILAMLANRLANLPDWRYPVVVDADGEDIDLAAVTDVDGDLNADLILRRRRVSSATRPYPHTEYRYAASTSPGATRAVESLPSQTQPDILAAKLPGLFDFDGNGTRDVVTGDAVYIVRPSGERLRQPASLGGGDFGTYLVEDLFPALARTSQIDVVVRDAIDWRVVTLGGVTREAGAFRGITVAERIAVVGASTRALFPLTPPAGFDSQGAKLLTGIGSGAQPIAHWRFDSATRSFRPLVDARLPQTAGSVTRLLPVRVGDLTGRADLTRNTLPQDVIALTGSDVFWFEAGADGYAAARRLDLGLTAGERVLTIGSGPYDGDPYEDLVVVTFTADPAVGRVYVFPQQSGGGPRFTTGSRIGPVATAMNPNLEEGFHPVRCDTARARLSTFAFFARGAQFLFGQTGDGTPFRIDVPISGASAQDCVLGDINGDGTPELISSDNELSPLIFWVSRY